MSSAVRFALVCVTALIFITELNIIISVLNFYFDRSLKLCSHVRYVKWLMDRLMRIFLVRDFADVFHKAITRFYYLAPYYLHNFSE